jgi:hypothetical protein
MSLYCPGISFGTLDATPTELPAERVSCTANNTCALVDFHEAEHNTWHSLHVDILRRTLKTYEDAGATLRECLAKLDHNDAALRAKILAQYTTVVDGERRLKFIIEGKEARDANRAARK